jgi:hypothetical protein
MPVEMLWISGVLVISIGTLIYAALGAKGLSNQNLQ